MRDSGLPRLLIVASHLDTVATRFRADLVKRGIRTKIVDGQTCARMFTIRNSKALFIHPDIPIFYRPSGWWSTSTRRTRDEEFLAGECYATFWAAANQIPSPVINRPSGSMPLRRMTTGSLRCLAPVDHRDDCHQMAEGYVSDRSQISDNLDGFWGEDATFRVLPAADFPTDMPLRFRRLPASIVGYEVVTVVGSKAFIATFDAKSEEHEVAKRSVKLAREANVHFCSLTWEITSSSAEVVRMDPAPPEHELRYRWADIVSALVEDLQLC